MGADGNLIKAAGQMGPKAWDYSGIIKAIDAIGKYTAHKRAVASELTSWGDQNIDVDSIPEGLLSGAYGDQNMDFMINKKTQYKNASKTIGKLFPGSQKYKNAIKTINNTKKSLQLNKADATIWNGIWNKRSEYLTKMSKGTPFQVEDRVLELAMDGSTNSLSGSLVYGDNGIHIAVSQQMQDIDGNEIIDVVSVRDYLNGYEENLVTQDIQTKISGIINKWGKKSADSGDTMFLDDKARDEFRGLFTLMKENGFAGIRSMAYDYQGSVNGENQSYVEANSEYITNMTNEEWVEKVSELRRQTSIDGNDYVLLPTADEIAVMKEQVSAWAFDANNQAELESKMMDWFVGLAKTDFESSQENPRTRKGEQRSVKLDWTGPDNTAVYLRPTEIPGIAKGAKERTTFVVGGTRFKYLNNQWVWDASGKGDEPVTGSKGQNYDHKDGSDEALLYRLNNNPIISEALKLSNNSQVIINNDESNTNFPDTLIQIQKDTTK